MKSSQLVAVWSAPDNSRLMPKQTSVRLATQNEARIAALCDLYPSRSKSQIINDLLATALDEVADGFEFVPGPIRELEHDGHHEYEIAEDIGERVRFLNLANKYLVEFENALGVKEPKTLPTSRWGEVGKK